MNVFNGAPVIFNGASKCSELKPVVVNGTTVIFDRVPDSLDGAPVTVNEAPNALDGRQWYKITHLWFFMVVAGLRRALFVEKRLGEHSSSLGEHLERLGEHVLPQRDIKFHLCRRPVVFGASMIGCAGCRGVSSVRPAVPVSGPEGRSWVRHRNGAVCRLRSAWWEHHNSYP